VESFGMLQSRLSTRSIIQRRSAFLDKVKDEAEKYKCGCGCGLVQAIIDDNLITINDYKGYCADYNSLGEDIKELFEQNNISREQWNQKSKRERLICLCKINKEEFEKKEEEERRNSR
jgi:hypothetical protein